MSIDNFWWLPPYMFIDDDWSFDQELFNTLNNGYQNNKENNKEEDFIPWNKAYFSPRLSPQDFIQLSWLQEKDINNKNIVDIWWWASTLALLLKNNYQPKSIEIVDPIFEKYDFDIVTKQVIKNLKWLSKDKWKYSENQKALINVLEKYQQGEYKWVNTNPSYWNHIKWIKSDSQDIIFINHLLHKLDKKQVIDTLQEADRILKKNGEIIIIEYPEDSRIINQSSEYITRQNTNALCIKLKKEDRKNFY